MKYSFEVEKNPKAEIIKQIRNELISHNIKSSAISQSANVALKVLSSEGELIGGAIAWQWGGCLEIEYLWITENARGNNLGTELILKLETLLNGHSNKVIITNTFSFQAPEFYLKNGFKVADIVVGYPDNIKKYFLKKNLQS